MKLVAENGKKSLQFYIGVIVSIHHITLYVSQPTCWSFIACQRTPCPSCSLRNHALYTCVLSKAWKVRSKRKNSHLLPRVFPVKNYLSLKGHRYLVSITVLHSYTIGYLNVMASVRENASIWHRIYSPCITIDIIAATVQKYITVIIAICFKGVFSKAMTAYKLSTKNKIWGSPRICNEEITSYVLPNNICDIYNDIY